MSTDTSTNAGGFVCDPTEAFTPPAASGCCGSPATATVASGPAPLANACCGTTQAAEAAGSCCDPAAKTEAIAAGTGCCG